MDETFVVYELEEFPCPWCGRPGSVGIVVEDGKENAVMMHEVPQCPNFIACDDPAHYILGIVAGRKSQAS